MGTSFASPFLEGRGSPAPADEASLDAALERALSAARAAHPSVEVAAEAFARFLGEKCRGADPVEQLSNLAVGDLLLAWAALQGNRAALSELDALLSRVAEGTARVGGSEAFASEVHQRLSELALVGSKGIRPKLWEYAGTGPLEGWCRVSATRLALRLKRVPDREVTLKPELFEEAPAVTGIETAANRRQHSKALAEAFAAAARELTSEDRTLLRYHFLDGLNFEEIAPLFGTHRSTISRRVAAVREKLLEATKRGLQERLGANSSELSSLLRAAQSEIDLDLTAWLRTQS